MRKILFLALAFAFVGTGVADAQVVDRTWGARLGVSVADADIEDIEGTFETENQTGFVAGLFVNNYWGLFGGQLEASYIQKGATLDVGELDVDGETSIDYIELAALLKLGLPLGIVRPSAFGGVGVDFKVSCSDEVSDAICDNLASTDYSAILGADLAAYLGGFSIWGDGRYMIGLSDISDIEDIEYKNQGFTFQAGVGFAL